MYSCGEIKIIFHHNVTLWGHYFLIYPEGDAYIRAHHTCPDQSGVYLQCSGVYTACALHVHCKLNSVHAVYTDNAYTIYCRGPPTKGLRKFDGVRTVYSQTLVKDHLD